MANAVVATFFLRVICHFGICMQMDHFANDLIDALGGTTATATIARTGISTVHNWRKNGLSPSRLDHLRRIVRDEFPTISVEALAAKHDVDLPEIGLAGEGGVADHEIMTSAVEAQDHG